jgi:hypothetical protein
MKGGDLMVRSAAQRRVSNHESLRPSFETRSLRSAPQDEEFNLRVTPESFNP